MAFIIPRGIARPLAGALSGCLLIGLLAACSGGTGDLSAALRPIPKETQELLAKKGMASESPIFIRVFKEESELEVWKQRDDGRFHHLKSYPVCNWSGDLGPKLRKGDKQAPEGFYTVAQGQMNPNSQFHLAFNVGFPNPYDKVHGRTGAALMVHGDCKSAGCYAMTDALMEEIYALVRESFKGGQERFEVHAFPFRMTPENMARHAKSPWMPFWRTLKEGHDHFELTRQTPLVAVCEKRYLINAQFKPGVTPKADERCPPYQKIKPDLFAARPGEQMADAARITAPGKKTRTVVADASVAAAEPARKSGFFTWWNFGTSTARASRGSPPTGLGFNQ
jgi:murein L,D-transpeptidase YafK